MHVLAEGGPVLGNALILIPGVAVREVVGNLLQARTAGEGAEVPDPLLDVLFARVAHALDELVHLAAVLPHGKRSLPHAVPALSLPLERPRALACLRRIDPLLRLESKMNDTPVGLEELAGGGRWMKREKEEEEAGGLGLRGQA
eukprot:768214-Hanusia_phi.AAC.5